MAGYQRKTALPPKEVLSRAEDILPDRVGLSRLKSSGRLRTSRLDYEVQVFLNHLPYEPGDEKTPEAEAEG